MIVGTPTYAVPSWLVQKDPDVMVVNAGGREKYGRRQIFDLLNPTFRFHAERVIRQLVSHTAPHRQVIGFQIDNETKHYDNRGREISTFRRVFIRRFGCTPIRYRMHQCDNQQSADSGL